MIILQLYAKRGSLQKPDAGINCLPARSVTPFAPFINSFAHILHPWAVNEFDRRRPAASSGVSPPFGRNIANFAPLRAAEYRSVGNGKHGWGCYRSESHSPFPL